MIYKVLEKNITKPRAILMILPFILKKISLFNIWLIISWVSWFFQIKYFETNNLGHFFFLYFQNGFHVIFM